MQDELTGLTTFLAVAEHRSFTAAGGQLGVSASAVSQAVRQLEDRLGVRLLHRTTRSVGLTEAGRRFYDRARPAIGDLRDALASLDELRGRPAGTLRLNIPRLASAMVIEPILGAFLAAHPDVRLDIASDDSLADIVEGGFDAGIRLGETLDKEMIAVPITGELRIAVVGSPAYFAQHGRPRHPRELLDHACIRWRHLTSGAIYRWEFTEGGKDFDLAVDGRLIVNDHTLMVRGALDGIGLAHVIRQTVAEPLARGELIAVLADYCPPFPGFSLYYPTRAHLPPKLQALIEFLAARRRPRRSR